MDDDEVLAPAAVAAAVAPVIDRLRIGIARRVPPAAAPLLERFRLTPAEAQVMSMLRNLLPDRVADVTSVHAAFLYSPVDETDAALAVLTAAGLIAVGGTDEVAVTNQGREFLLSLRSAMQGIIEELWAQHGGAVSRLSELAARAMEAATRTAGPAFKLMSPPYEPAGTPPATLLAERLTPLPFHRYDAHAAAWHQAGLTAVEVQTLPPGPRHDAVEADTNTRAAAPYAALQPTSDLCSALASECCRTDAEPVITGIPEMLRQPPRATAYASFAASASRTERLPANRDARTRPVDRAYILGDLHHVGPRHGRP